MPQDDNFLTKCEEKVIVIANYASISQNVRIYFLLSSS